MLGAPKDFRSLLDGNRELRPSFLAKKSDPEQREWKLGGYMINHGIFSASGEMLLCASRDLLLVNVTTGHTTTLAAAESGTFVEACALSPDDGALAAAALGSRLAIFDTRSGAAVSSIDASAPLVCCALSPRRGNDVQAAAADSAGSVSVWRLPSAQRSFSQGYFVCIASDLCRRALFCRRGVVGAQRPCTPAPLAQRVLANLF